MILSGENGMNPAEIRRAKKDKACRKKEIEDLVLSLQRQLDMACIINKESYSRLKDLTQKTILSLEEEYLKITTFVGFKKPYM